MRWRREVNYHGSRGYGSEEAPVRLSSLTIAWLIEMLKMKLERFRAGSPRVVSNDRPRNASLLVSESRAAPVECAFPVKPQIREHDWRVLP